MRTKKPLTIPTVEEVYNCLSTINKDCLKDEIDTYVSFTDTDYYAEQIHNIYGDNISDAAAALMTDEVCEKLAEGILEMAIARNENLDLKTDD